MKYWTLCLGLMACLITMPAAASEEIDFDREDRIVIELRRQPNPERYTFQDYLSDLRESARISEINPENPVRRLEARKEKKHEPLNPIVFRW